VKDGNTGFTDGRLTWGTELNGYNIATHANAGFVIGNKGNYTATGGSDASTTQDFNQKIADLRIYSMVFDSYEYARILYGDDARSASTYAIAQYSYRPFGNRDITLDATQEDSQRNSLNQLTPGAVTFDEDEMAAVFAKENAVLYSRNHGYINSKTGATINNDFSDYMRKCKFGFSARVRLTSPKYNGGNYPYYVFTTGSYSNSFALAPSLSIP
jgi:hypothetical protein